MWAGDLPYVTHVSPIVNYLLCSNIFHGGYCLNISRVITSIKLVLGHFTFPHQDSPFL